LIFDLFDIHSDWFPATLCIRIGIPRLSDCAFRRASISGRMWQNEFRD
jgi:hypothetical protein